MEATNNLSLLQQIEEDWLAQGWDLSALKAFRMEGEGDPDDEDEDDEDDDDDPKKGQKFTQEQVNKFLAKEKKTWKKSVQAELLKELGVDNLDQVKAMVKKFNDEESKNKTEAERAADEAKKNSAASDAAKAEAAEDRLMAKIERQLAKAGVEDEDLEDIALLVRRRVEDDADADAVKDAVEAQKTKTPKLFTSTSEDGEQDPPKGGERPKPKGVGDSKPPKKGTPPADARGQARSMLESRHPKLAANKQ